MSGESEQKTVLIADDERSYLKGYEQILSREYDVRTANGGEEAVEIFDPDIDIVLVDRKMPDMSGDEVVEEIREMNNDDCAILMITGVEPEMDIVELGVDDYITKPVSKEELEKSVEEASTWTEYNDQLRDYFSLANKRDTLLEKNPSLRNTEQVAEIDDELDALARQGVQQEAEMLQSLVQSVPDAIVALDEDGKVTLWNNGSTDIFGWEYDEVVGDDPPMFTTDDEATEKLEDIRGYILNNETVSDIELTCKTKTGSLVDTSVSAAPLHTAEQSHSGTVFVFTDITERKQHQQRLDVINRFLRHNVRNELTPILGHLEIIAEEMPDEYNERIATVQASAQELDELAEQARDVYHVLDGETDVDAWDIADLVDRQIEHLEEEHPDARIQLDTPSTPPRALVGTDFDIVVENIVENAIIHSDSTTPTVDVTVRTEGDGSRVVVAVSDDGPPIPDSELKALAMEGENDLTHSSGIGLWASKWIVEQYGGEIKFETDDSSGNVVTIYVPSA